jgi:GST-like protein
MHLGFTTAQRILYRLVCTTHGLNTVWRWNGALVEGELYEAGEFLNVHGYQHVLRWAGENAQRPAVQRGRKVNRTAGEAFSQLYERHVSSDFDTQTQDKLVPRE